MSSQMLVGKNIAVLGYGVTGQACAQFLVSQQALVSVYDKQHKSLSSPLTFTLLLDTSDFSAFDYVVVSPGINPVIPSLRDYQAKGGHLISEIELFSWFNTKPLIGVTGSNGKTTVSDMIGKMILGAGKRVAVGGNIGQSALTLLEQDVDIIVLELSSFQLQLTHSLHLEIAVLLNLSEDHLDRHGSMHAYLAAKQNVFNHAKTAICIDGVSESFPRNELSDVKRLVINTQSDTNSVTKFNEMSVDGTNKHEVMGLYFDALNNHLVYQEQVLVDCSLMKLVGYHNVLNTAVVSAIGITLGLAKDKIASALYEYRPMPHRTELVVSGDTTWIDDSKATNVGATIAALQGLAGGYDRVCLIAGGDAKGADITGLKSFFGTSVHALFTLGKDGNAFKIMAQQCLSEEPSLNLMCQSVSSMIQAVQHAAAWSQEQVAKHHKVLVLMSPACASIDMFKNYQHRGEVFKEAVLALEGTHAKQS